MNYTFCNNAVNSYIDHILVPDYLLDSIVMNCKILTEAIDNLSDHLAVSIMMDIPVYKRQCSDVKSASGQGRNYKGVRLRPRWNDPRYQNSYSEELCNILEDVCIPDQINITHESANNYVSKLCNDLCCAMRDAEYCASRNFAYITKSEKSWWNKSCTEAWNCNHLFYRIWSCLGRPRTGEVYNCYREARKAYKKTCKKAVNSKTHEMFQFIEKLSKEKKPGMMWNIIRKTKKPVISTNAISIQTLEDYFTTKFDMPRVNTNILTQASDMVKEKYESCRTDVNVDFVLSKHSIVKYIRKLKLGTAPGIDQIRPEHLKYGINSSLPELLSHMFTVCVRYGVIPESFTVGLLIPILKKINIDPMLPSNYRPITISVTFSKLLEYHILECCSSHVFSASQFGFAASRGTNMATSLAYDLCMYAQSSGSTLFTCSLDAQGAFDCLPHPVLLQKLINVIPDRYWRLLHIWYFNMCTVKPVY